MPPRYTYWTILIDNGPTAFRARDKEELLPTLYQLRRKNANVVIKWFARGRLWDTPEQAQWAGKNLEREKKDRDWRPGGEHKDLRARFDRRKRKGVAPHGGQHRSRRDKPAGVAKVFRPADRKPSGVAQVFRPADYKPTRTKPKP